MRGGLFVQMSERRYKQLTWNILFILDTIYEVNDKPEKVILKMPYLLKYKMI